MTHFAAVFDQALEAIVRDPLAESTIEQEVAVTPRVFRRGYSSPHPRNTREGEAVSGARDVREDRGGDTLADVKGAIVAGNVGLDLGDCSSRHDVGGRGSV